MPARTQSSFRRMPILMAAVSVAVVIMAAIVIWRVSPANGGLRLYDPIATVNGEPIAYGELKHDLEAGRSVVHNYFLDKYGAEDNENFWTTNYGGEVPIEKLKQQALEGSIKRKAQELAAVQYGILKVISYRGLLRELDETNAERQEKVKRNEVIYGPITYDEQRYIDERSQVLRRDLKEKLAAAFKLTDQDAEVYYEQNKALFSLHDSRTVRAIEAHFANQEERKKNGEAALAKLEAIQKRLHSGTDFDTIYNELAAAKDDILVVSETVYDYRTPRTDSILHPNLFESINQLGSGEVTGIIEDEPSVGIYACTEMKSLGYAPLNEVKGQVMNSLMEQRYDEWMAKWLQSAQIDINEDNMKQVTMDE